MTHPFAPALVAPLASAVQNPLGSMLPSCGLYRDDKNIIGCVICLSFNSLAKRDLNKLA